MKMSPEQNKLYENLKKIDQRIAEIYSGAIKVLECKIMMKDFANLHIQLDMFLR